MVLVTVTEGTNMVKIKKQNTYTRNTVVISLVPIMLLSLSTLVGSLLSFHGFPTVVYGYQEVGNSKEFTWYDKSIAINQNNVPALVQKGTDLVNAGEGQQAIIWLDKALKIDPSNMMALVSKGAALRGRGEYQDGGVMYERGLAIDADDVYAVGGKADALYGGGELQ